MTLYDLGLLYAAVVWGASFPIVKAALADVDPVAMVAYRFILSGAFLLPLVLRRPSLWAGLREGVVLGALLMILYVSQTAGLRFTTASNSGFITGLFILFVPLFLFFFADERPDPGQWAGIALALGGLFLLTGGIRGFNQGDAMTLLAALTYAAHLLATDRYVRADSDPVLLAFHQFWFCGLGCLVFAWTAGCPLGVASTRGWWTLLYLALVPNLSAFFIQLVAQKRTPPIKVSLIFSLEPVFAAAFAWTLGGERFELARGLGGALILAGMVAGELSRLQLLGGRRKEVLPV